MSVKFQSSWTTFKQLNALLRQAMDIDPLFLFALAIFIAVMCFGTLIFAGLIFLFVKRIASFNKMLTAELPVPSAENFVDSAVLRPWETDGLRDLSCHWKGDWRNTTRLGRYEGYTRGIIQSLCEPDGTGWLAFTIDSDNRQVRQGIIRLKTSMQQIELKISGDRLSLSMQVQACVDGSNWGSITVAYPTCVYRSRDGFSEARWAPVLRPKRLYIPGKLIVADPHYYPLIVNNRQVAALADLWIRQPQTGKPRPFPAALQAVSPGLSANEEAILLMMLGMSLYFDTLKNWRIRYDW
jgi:hypothetical protein